MAGDLHAYRPAGRGPTALFLDTSGLFPYFHPDTSEHDEVRNCFRAIRDGDLPYRPLFTSTYVVDELVTLLLSRGRRQWAVDALELLTGSDSVTVLDETAAAFDRAGEYVRQYDDAAISFTDHFCAVQMEQENVDHVLAFDGDYERHGLTVLPRT